MDDTFGVQWRSYVKSWVNKQEPWTMHDSYDALWTLNNEHLGSGVKVMLSLFLSTERLETITIARCWQIIFEKKTVSTNNGFIASLAKNHRYACHIVFPNRNTRFSQETCGDGVDRSRVHGQEHPDNIKDQLWGFFEKFLGNTWIHACKEKKSWWWPGKWVKRSLIYTGVVQDPKMDYESAFWWVHVSPYLDPIILSYTQIFWLFMKAPQPWRRLFDKRSKI